MHHTIPAIYKPADTLLVDDDELFIENVQALLPAKYNTHIIEAQDLASIYRSQLFTLTEDKEFKSLTPADILSTEILAPSPVSAIVIDQCMNPNNGLDILRRIRSPFVQKILISNFFSSQEAVDALNQKTISCFLCKMDPQFIPKLSAAIEEAKKHFFLQLSSMIPDFFRADNPLLEPKTAEIFQKIELDFGVKYYHPSADLTQFEFFDRNGDNKITMNIFCEEELNGLLESYHAQSAPAEIVSLIKSGIVLPCGDENGFPEGKDWLHHLKSANSFQGKQKYFYSIYKARNNAATTA